MKRWLYLTFSSLTVFTTEIFVDQSAPLVGRLSGTADACLDGRDTSCLNFTASEFNGLYVAHFWMGVVAAVCASFCMWKYGIWRTSLGTAVLLCTGLVLFTVGPYITSTIVAFWVMLCGRLIFSVGYYTQIVMSLQVLSHWFYGRELALALTLCVASARIGSIVTLAAVGELAQQVGLQRTLWITFAIVIVAPVSAVVGGWIYREYASAAVDAAIYTDSARPNEFGFRRLTKLGREYWIIAAMIFFFFGALLTVLADLPKFLTDTYGYTEASAGQVTGLIPDIAVCTPIFGFVIDKYGGRDIVNSVGTALIFFGLLAIVAIPNFLPAVTCAFLGISYAVMTAGIWGSVPVVTTPSTVGVAMGLGISFQALGSGLTLLVTGFLLDETSLSLAKRWENFFIVLAVLSGLSWLLSGVSMYADTKNPSRPLRVKHTVPVMVEKVGPVPVVDESSPLLRVTDSIPTTGKDKLPGESTY